MSKAQEYNYIHYTNKDGLAGNTVYGVAQDKEGYLFFATENGLSRYDGKEWVTFTVKDGLPDNEILVIFGDSKGRIWMSCFSKAVCYYYKGKIYNAGNDSLMKRIKVNSIVYKIYEEEDCNVIFLTEENIFSISKQGIIKLLLSSKSKKNNFKNPNGFSAYKNLVDSGSILLKYDSIFTHNKAKISFITQKQCDSLLNLTPYTKKYNSFIKSEYLKNLKIGSVNKWEVESKYSIFVNTSDGSWYISTYKNVNEHFLTGIKTGHTYQDKEGTIWFTTLGQGVYKLPSVAIKTYAAPNTNNTSNKEIFSICKNNKNVLAGASFGKIIISNRVSKTIYDFQNYLKNTGVIINRATSSTEINTNIKIIGFDCYLLKLQNNQPSFNYKVMPVKSVEKIDDTKILVGSKIGTYTVNVSDLLPIDTLFTERTTYANYYNHQYYIGTINGLYVISENKHQIYLGDIHPSLKRRITCIKNTSDGKTLIATADAGIVILKNNKVVAKINIETGLSSNIVKALHINSKFVWVGTIKGINKIDLLTNKIVANYSTSDGLPSDIINAIYFDNVDSTVWVGSPEGLTYFKEKEISSNSICNLVMQQITVSNNPLKVDSNNYSFRYKDNNIRFQFVGVSFRSGDDITYHYKLQGLNDEWKITNERILDFPSLPYDKNYSLQLYATNKFGVDSKVIKFNFYVSTPFYLTTWFNILILLSTVTIVYLVLKRRFEKAKQIQAEKSLIKQQLADMEQLALQAQMNPHFIFNCLNSIQQFIMVDDKFKANQYLTEFASLIRSTLDNSSKKNISIADEALYLKRYLDLEQLRFGDSFTYEINMDLSVDKNFTEMPSMLLQPFVENSLRHGVRLKKTGKGIIKIDFVESGNYLICRVLDNGVGREVSAKSKSQQHIEYQSRGMDLTIKRINLLNTEATHNATVEIIDLKDENGVGIGTEVVVRIPLD